MTSFLRYQADLDGERFISDLRHNISRLMIDEFIVSNLTTCSRPVVFDAIMRVRTSTGVRPTDFFGAFYMVRYEHHLQVQKDVNRHTWVTCFKSAGQYNRHGACLVEQWHGHGLRDQAWRQVDRRGWGLHSGEPCEYISIYLNCLYIYNFLASTLFH